MGCFGCGAKYKGLRRITGRRLPKPKYKKSKPSKQPPKPTSLKKIDHQVALSLLASISNSMPK